MRRVAPLLLSCLALAACGRGQPAQPATPMTASPAVATVDGLVLRASTLAIADLNPATAARYGIDRTRDGVLLLVTVRDDAGNAADPGGLRLSATAAVLPDPPTPLALRAIATDGLTDYLGVVPARPPSSVRIELRAARGGSRAGIATMAELQPH